MSILPVRLLLLLACCSYTLAARFSVNGPVLTVTLKDPDVSQEEGKWLDIGSLRPNALWSLQSKGAPLPQWLPSLKGVRGSLTYRYEDFPNLPATVEGEARFAKEGLGDLQIQPSHHLRSRRTSVIVQATRGNFVSLLTRISSGGKGLVDFVKGSLVLDLPFNNLSAVKLTPAFDFGRRQPSCTMEGITGSGRTKAVLNLQMQEPTLTVVHALDERNTIAPEISLQTAKIMYNWKVALDSGSLNTSVDPTSAIHVSWVDRSMTGRWVTDFTLPLKGTTIHALAANVRVRRQFTF